VGDVKENLSPKTEKGKSLFDRFKKKDKKGTSSETSKKDTALKQEAAQTFIDTLAVTEEKLEKLISIKTSDLSSEKNSIPENTIKLAKLKTMRFHLNEIVEEAISYSNGDL
jgi:hypothetical protein